MVALHGDAFGTCSAVAGHGSNDRPRVHVTSDSAAAAVVAWPGEPQDSNRICQSHLPHRPRTRRCERTARSCRRSDHARS